jgi:hypothetical protein
MSQGLTKLIQPDYGEGTITILPWAYSTITAGTWTVAISSAYVPNFTFYNSSNAINDQINYKVTLAAGAYEVIVVGFQTTSVASVNVLLDNVSVGFFDMYGASSANGKWTIGLSVLTTGIHTLSLVARTGLGGSNAIYFHGIIFRRIN